MPCFHPIPAWRAQQLTSKGKLGVTFRRREGTPSELNIPCGQCIGCKLEKARQWAMRIEHERQQHLNSSFITLTYDDEHVPANMSLRPEDFTLFMKRLRKELGEKVRYYQCGEYGETTRRPHHHAVLFGYWPSDGVPLHRLHVTGEENQLWTSKQLERLWGQGNVSVGAVTWETASYVAGYVTKKITGDRAAAHYGERLPEYATMSRRPGLGNLAFRKHGRFYYQNDAIILRGGMKMKPPRYYDTLLEKTDPQRLEDVRAERKRQGRVSLDNKGTRLTAREAYRTARYNSNRKRDLT